MSTSAENLHGIWSVFSKCADSLEDGKRLENLSWRIWTRETLCCPSLPGKASGCTTTSPRKADLPRLSASVDSLASVESHDGNIQGESLAGSGSTPLEINHHPSKRSTGAAQSAVTRCKSNHITPIRFERMLESIQEAQTKPELSPEVVRAVQSTQPSPAIALQSTPLTVHAPLRSSESSSSTVPLSSPGSDHSVTPSVRSDTSIELSLSNSHIVRGFAPNQVSSSYRSKTHLAPTTAPSKPIPQPVKAVQPTFMLGGSSGDDESSLDNRTPSQSKQSSLTVGLKKSAPPKKQLSFKDELAKRTSYEDEKVFESDDEDSSATESDSDDEDEEWEDDGSEDADNTADDRPMFQRVDSTPNLVSRRSLLTTQLNEGDRQADFARQAHAQSQPALRKAKTQTCLDSQENGGFIPGPQSKRPKVINMTSSNAQATPIAFSPRTTRRHMLATEMTESLRKAVLYERQQKKATANAVMKRRHTTQDLTHMRNYPESEGGKENHSWNDDYTTEDFHDYHKSGW